MFERPIKGDLDRSLSLLMHEAHHKVMDERNRIKGDAIKAGALQSNRVIVTVAKAADTIHQQAMEQAKPMLLDFIERMQLAPAEITGWARPHLENLGNTVLGTIPPNGFPADHQRIRAQYAAVFQQRLDGVLRDVEIGFVKGAGFAHAEKVESKEEWITAAGALHLLRFTMGHGAAIPAICARAHDGVIRARAQRYVEAGKAADNVEIPPKFWWARGKAALTQNWITGDFETWIDQRVHLKAYGVTFLRADIDRMIPDTPKKVQTAVLTSPSKPVGGRPKADWWEDLWIEICRQLYSGDLQPKTQADIEKAMLKWLSERDESASTSTIRERARKLWKAITRDGN